MTQRRSSCTSSSGTLASPGGPVAGDTFVVDLKTQTVVIGDEQWTFDIGALQKRALLHGLDDLEPALQDVGAIAEWQAHDREVRPLVWRGVNEVV